MASQPQSEPTIRFVFSPRLLEDIRRKSKITFSAHFEKARTIREKYETEQEWLGSISAFCAVFVSGALSYLLPKGEQLSRSQLFFGVPLLIGAVAVPNVLNYRVALFQKQEDYSKNAAIDWQELYEDATSFRNQVLQNPKNWDENKREEKLLELENKKKILNAKHATTDRYCHSAVKDNVNKSFFAEELKVATLYKAPQDVINSLQEILSKTNGKV